MISVFGTIHQAGSPNITTITDWNECVKGCANEPGCVLAHENKEKECHWYQYDIIGYVKKLTKEDGERVSFKVCSVSSSKHLH